MADAEVDKRLRLQTQLPMLDLVEVDRDGRRLRPIVYASGYVALNPVEKPPPPKAAGGEEETTVDTPAADQPEQPTLTEQVDKLTLDLAEYVTGERKRITVTITAWDLLWFMNPLLLPHTGWVGLMKLYNLADEGAIARIKREESAIATDARLIAEEHQRWIAEHDRPTPPTPPAPPPLDDAYWANHEPLEVYEGYQLDRDAGIVRFKDPRGMIAQLTTKGIDESVLIPAVVVVRFAVELRPPLEEPPQQADAIESMRYVYYGVWDGKRIKRGKHIGPGEHPIVVSRPEMTIQVRLDGRSNIADLDAESEKIVEELITGPTQRDGRHLICAEFLRVNCNGAVSGVVWRTDGRVPITEIDATQASRPMGWSSTRLGELYPGQQGKAPAGWSAQSARLKWHQLGRPVLDQRKVQPGWRWKEIQGG